MNEHGLPCRRCGQVTGDVVIIYGPDQVGRLTPKGAQCRGRCGKKTPAARTAIRGR